MSTLAIVEVVLREAGMPLTARDIVALAGARLPSRSKTPETVVARDLSVHIKRLGDASLFVRTAPGYFTLRELHAPAASAPIVELLEYVRVGAPKPMARATSTSDSAVGQSVMVGSA